MFKDLVSSLPEQHSTSSKSRRRLYAVLALAAVVVIAVAFFIPLFIVHIHVIFLRQFLK
ncbi:MAG: hypothetical protein WC325_13795 [Candidatus Bathyarchaeia archaeon]